MRCLWREVLVERGACRERCLWREFGFSRNEDCLRMILKFDIPPGNN